MLCLSCTWGPVTFLSPATRASAGPLEPPLLRCRRLLVCLHVRALINAVNGTQCASPLPFLRPPAPPSWSPISPCVMSPSRPCQRGEAAAHGCAEGRLGPPSRPPRFFLSDETFYPPHDLRRGRRRPSCPRPRPSHRPRPSRLLTPPHAPPSAPHPPSPGAEISSSQLPLPPAGRQAAGLIDSEPSTFFLTRDSDGQVSPVAQAHLSGLFTGRGKVASEAQSRSGPRPWQREW